MSWLFAFEFCDLSCVLIWVALHFVVFFFVLRVSSGCVGWDLRLLELDPKKMDS